MLHLTKNKQTKFINGNTEKSDLGKFDTLSSDCVKVASLMGIAAQGFKPSVSAGMGAGYGRKEGEAHPNMSPGLPMSEREHDHTTTKATLTEGIILLNKDTTSVLSTALELGINTDLSQANSQVAQTKDVKAQIQEQQQIATAVGHVLTDCDIVCREIVPGLLVAANDFSEEQAIALGSILSKIPAEQRSQIDMLVQSENSKTLEAIENSKSDVEKHIALQLR